MKATDYHARGIWLREAPNRLASRNIAPAQPTRPSHADGLAGGWEMLAQQAGWDEARRKALKGALDGVAQISKAFLASGANNYQRARYVADMVVKGRAIATGFREGGTEPEIIPAYLFRTDRFINWGNDEVSGNNFHFISVRITKLRGGQKPPAIPEASQNKKKAGRTGFPELAEIAAELKSDPEFTLKSQKVQGQILLRKARERYPDRFPPGKVISPATLYRYLGNRPPKS